MCKRLTPKSTLMWCISILIVILFFSLLGVGIYAAIMGIPYGQAWLNFFAALRALFNLIGDAINKTGG